MIRSRTIFKITISPAVFEWLPSQSHPLDAVSALCDCELDVPNRLRTKYPCGAEAVNHGTLPGLFPIVLRRRVLRCPVPPRQGDYRQRGQQEETPVFRIMKPAFQGFQRRPNRDPWIGMESGQGGCRDAAPIAYHF